MDLQSFRRSRLATIVFALVLSARPVLAADAAPATGLPPDTLDRIDAAAREVLARTGVPSASIAIVLDSRTVYTHAYGQARLDPVAPADAGMRYAIGSVSKQFTAAALLLLVQDGKLSLDDRVSKFMPELTRAGEVTIRQLLSHTSGFQDYWPQDYVMPEMMAPATPGEIMARWAQRPLDYEPGTRWQYSNTGFVIAGAIVEQVSGQPFFEFLERRIFAPLGMGSVQDIDRHTIGSGGLPTGYRAFALGPPRVAPVAGTGWLYGAGQLAMTAADLAKWNISIIDRSLLSAASYRELETDTRLATGVGTGYGLGVGVELVRQRRVLEHGGEVSGFTASNTVYPEQGAAIVVLVNQDASRATEQLAGRLEEIVFEQAQATDDARTAQARAIFEGLQSGRLDRSILTANANSYFSEQAIADFKASLAPLGVPREFTQTQHWLRGGMTGRAYAAVFADRTLRVWTYETPDGKLEQFQVAVQE